MSVDLVLSGVGYWYGFSLLAGIHFFVRTFDKLQRTLALRLWRLLLSILLVAGVVSFVFFSNYTVRTMPETDTQFKGLFLGAGVYMLFAWLWIRHVKRSA